MVVPPKALLSILNLKWPVCFFQEIMNMYEYVAYRRNRWEFPAISSICNINSGLKHTFCTWDSQAKPQRLAVTQASSRQRMVMSRTSLLKTSGAEHDQWPRLNDLDFLSQFSNQKKTMSGWWFGTWILFFHILVRIISTDEHVVQRDRSTTNQMSI